MSGLKDLEPFMNSAGVSRMVYAIPWPETRKTREQLWEQKPHRLYTHPCSKKQDGMHIELGEMFCDWVKPIIRIDRSVFRAFHMTNGSSEAVKEIIAQFAVDTRCQGSIHVFEGEYEGYELYAQNYHLNVIKHPRSDQFWHEGPKSENEMFFISQPSAIDGNVWPELENFLGKLGKTRPKMKVILDIAYLGCTAKQFTINIGHFGKNVSAITWSMSKSLGTFYDRIGGVFSTENIPGLYENIWLKNVVNIELGKKLLQNVSSPFEIPEKYSPLQALAINRIKERTGRIIIPSDVILLGYANKKPWEFDNVDQVLCRCAEPPTTEPGLGLIRYCLSPTLEQMVNSNH